ALLALVAGRGPEDLHLHRHLRVDGDGHGRGGGDGLLRHGGEGLQVGRVELRRLDVGLEVHRGRGVRGGGDGRDEDAACGGGEGATAGNGACVLGGGSCKDGQRCLGRPAVTMPTAGGVRHLMSPGTPTRSAVGFGSEYIPGRTATGGFPSGFTPRMTITLSPGSGSPAPVCNVWS